MKKLALAALAAFVTPAVAQGVPDPCLSIDLRSFNGAVWTQLNWNNAHARLWDHIDFVPYRGTIAVILLNQHRIDGATWDYKRAWFEAMAGCSGQMELVATWWDDRRGLPQPGDRMTMMGVQGPAVDLYARPTGFMPLGVPIVYGVLDPWVQRANPYGYWGRRFRPDMWAVMLAPL